MCRLGHREGNILLQKEYKGTTFMFCSSFYFSSTLRGFYVSTLTSGVVV